MYLFMVQVSLSFLLSLSTPLLLFVMMLVLLVASWVLPITCVITAILTMVNMTWVTNLVFFCGIGACVLLRRSIGIHCSRKTLSQTSSCFRTCRRTRVCFQKPWKIFATLLWQRYACALCWPPRPARVRTLKTKPSVSWRGGSSRTPASDAWGARIRSVARRRDMSLSTL